jgi:hypothetical protein
VWQGRILAADPSGNPWISLRGESVLERRQAIAGNSPPPK